MGFSEFKHHHHLWKLLQVYISVLFRLFKSHDIKIVIIKTLMGIFEVWLKQNCIFFKDSGSSPEI